jgi:hypothetical protein
MSEPIPRQHLTPTPTPRPTPRPPAAPPELSDLRELARDVQINGKPSRPVPEPILPPDFEETPVADDEFMAFENPKRKKEKIVTPTLGEIYAAQGQYAKAIGVFEILRKKEPTNLVFIEKIKYLKKKLEEAGSEA